MEYEKCLVQVYEILNHLEEEEILKIPEKVIHNIENKKDKSYIWTYDETKDLINQEIDRKTIAILSYINLQYLLDEEEKKVLLNIHEDNEEKLFPKVGMVNFNNPIKYEVVKESEANIVQSIVEVNEEKWYQKICKILKKLVNK